MNRPTIYATALLRILALSAFLSGAVLSFDRTTIEPLAVARAFLLAYLFCYASVLLFRSVLFDALPRGLHPVLALGFPALGLALALFLLDGLLDLIVGLTLVRRVGIPVLILGQLWCLAEARDHPERYPSPADRIALHLLAAVAGIATGEWLV